MLCNANIEIMENDYIVDGLISEMKTKLPKGENLANFLGEVLSMGKEAVYRRLRKDVAFTFDEIALISSTLGVSIDKIIGNSFSKKATFDLNLLQSADPYESYYEIMWQYVRLFECIKDDPDSEVYTASNIIPFTLYSFYEHLSKFRLIRWIYQNGKIEMPHSLSEMAVPQKAIEVHYRLSNIVKQCGTTHFIWDSNVFYSFVKGIKYFAKLGLLSSVDVIELKKELYQLLSELESLSVKGEFCNGKKVAIYLSDIDFEATYTYIEKNNFQISLFRVYSINSIDSQDPKICAIQKNWIQSLKRHSTLITVSGEVQRIAFFERQKEIIETL